MSEKIWSDDAWTDYLYWQTQDKKTLKRINLLIKDLEGNPRVRVDYKVYVSHRITMAKQCVKQISGKVQNKILEKCKMNSKIGV